MESDDLLRIEALQSQIYRDGEVLRHYRHDLERLKVLYETKLRMLAYTEKMLLEVITTLREVQTRIQEAQDETRTP